MQNKNKKRKSQLQTCENTTNSSFPVDNWKQRRRAQEEECGEQTESRQRAKGHDSYNKSTSSEPEVDWKLNNKKFKWKTKVDR
jgi:hypothetical protein